MSTQTFDEIREWARSGGTLGVRCSPDPDRGTVVDEARLFANDPEASIATWSIDADGRTLIFEFADGPRVRVSSRTLPQSSARRDYENTIRDELFDLLRLSQLTRRTPAT